MYFSLKSKTGKHFFFGPCCVSLIREITVLRLFEMGVRGCVNILFLNLIILFIKKKIQNYFFLS